jgi:hypothetical protein
LVPPGLSPGGAGMPPAPTRPQLAIARCNHEEATNPVANLLAPFTSVQLQLNHHPPHPPSASPCSVPSSSQMHVQTPPIACIAGGGYMCLSASPHEHKWSAKRLRTSPRSIALSAAPYATQLSSNSQSGGTAIAHGNLSRSVLAKICKMGTRQCMRGGVLEWVY